MYFYLTVLVYCYFGAYFRQLFELCVMSYPSPLEDAAPLAAKVLIFTIAGVIEYAAMSLTIEVVPVAFIPVSWLLHNDAALIRLWDSCEVFLMYAFMCSSFAMRAKSFVRIATRNGRSMTAWSILEALIWHNPALACHLVYCRLLPRSEYASPRIFMESMIWGSFASILKSFGLHTNPFPKTTRDRTSTGFMGILTTSISLALPLALVGKLADAIPSLLIHTALFAQSSASKQRSGSRTYSSQQYLAPLWLRLKVPTILALPILAQGSIIIKRALRNALALINKVYFTLGSYIASPQAFSIQDPPPPPRVRLLTILPSDSSSHPIRVQLLWYSVSDTPSYSAISYSWGSKVPEHEVFVNGKGTLITRSAYTALLAHRSTIRSRFLWLDALCIDQSSVVDKDSQIPLMPQIYANATKVIIWLCPSRTTQLATALVPSKSAHLAVALVNRLFNVNRLNHSTGSRFRYEIDIEAARALKRMLQSEWFGRVWIVQEVVRATGRVRVQYGPARIDWDRLSWFAECLLRDSALKEALDVRIGYSGLGEQAKQTLDNMEMIRRLTLIKHQSPPLSLLFYLVQMLRSKCRFAATESVDQIYGLLGLSESPLISDLKPEYRTSLRRLYIDIIHDHLRRSPQEFRLDFLAHAGVSYPQGTLRLPSWVPDWSVSVVGQPLYGTDCSTELLSSSGIDKILNDAAKMASIAKTESATNDEQWKTKIQELVNQSKEKMLDLMFDATKGMGSYAKTLENDGLELNVCMFDRVRFVGRCYDILEGGNVGEACRTLQQWACLALDNDVFLRNCGKQPKTDVWQSIAEVLWAGIVDAQIDYTFTTTPNKVDSLHAFQTGEWFNKYILRDLRKATYTIDMRGIHSQSFFGRCLGTTKSGKMCLFPKGTEVGDQVCLISGAKVPFVLREVDTIKGNNNAACFNLVGPTFVTNLMYGEGLDGRPDFKLVEIR